MLVPTLGAVISNIILNWRSQNDPRRKIIEELRFLDKSIDKIYFPVSAGPFNAWFCTVLLIFTTLIFLIFKSILPFFPYIIVMVTEIVIFLQFRARLFNGEEILENRNDINGLNFWYYTRKFRIPILLTLYLNVYAGVTLSLYLSKSLIITSLYPFRIESVDWNLEEILLISLFLILLLLSIQMFSYAIIRPRKNISLYYQNLIKTKFYRRIKTPNGDIINSYRVTDINRSLAKLADIEDLVFRLRGFQVWITIWDSQGTVSGRILSIGRYLIIERQYSTIAISWEKIERLEVLSSTTLDSSKKGG